MTGRIVAAGSPRPVAPQAPRQRRAPEARARALSRGRRRRRRELRLLRRLPGCRDGRENLCPRLVYLNGAYADYLLVPAPFVERSTYLRPDGLAPELAALAEPLACVEHGLARLGLERPGAAESPEGSRPGCRSARPALRRRALGAGTPRHGRRSPRRPTRGRSRSRRGGDDPHRTVVERRALVDRTRVRDRHRRHGHGGRLVDGARRDAARRRRRSSSAAAPRPTGSSSRPFPSTTTNSSLLGSYHHTPRTFQVGDRSSLRGAVGLSTAPVVRGARWTTSKRRCGAMIDRRALKVVIRPR